MSSAQGLGGFCRLCYDFKNTTLETRLRINNFGLTASDQRLQINDFRSTTSGPILVVEGRTGMY